MFLIELAHRVSHFRLDPDAEFNAVAVGGVKQSVDAVGQFAGVDSPVTESGVVGIAVIFGAEPSVVHHEKLATHRRYVGHHGVHCPFH